MGFIAEEIQDKDRNLVDFNSLYRLSPDSRATFNPSKWCIDRERNAIFYLSLRSAGTGLGAQ